MVRSSGFLYIDNYTGKPREMYFNFCQRLTRTYGRQIYTSVSRNLMKQYADNTFEKKLRSTAFYWTGLGILVVGMSYSAVPLYRMFCQVLQLLYKDNNISVSNS